MIALSALVERIGPVDHAAALWMSARLDELAKPPGSLGRLEELGCRLAAISGRRPPKIDRATIFALAADHGVVEERVSAYPAVVTAQMVETLVRGGGAVNVLARHAGANVVVADVGVAAPLPPHPSLASLRIAPGTRNMTREPAMTRQEAERAIAAGVGLVERERTAGLDLAATGEMGIGNTTAASAIAAVLTGAPIEEVTGPGTGVDQAGRQRKIAAIRRAIEINRPDARDPLDVLAKVGGLEIAGLVGVVLAGAAGHIPVVLDGFISGAAALVAVRLNPACQPYLLASHRSAEPGHRHVLEALGLVPYLDLGMRLGEGTGAALLVSLARAAVAIVTEMATFESAGVSGPIAEAPSP